MGASVTARGCRDPCTFQGPFSLGNVYLCPEVSHSNKKAYSGMEIQIQMNPTQPPPQVDSLVDQKLPWIQKPRAVLKEANSKPS